MLVEKYRPKNLSEVVGNKQNLIKIYNFVKNFKQGKGIILYGSSGCGKTSIVYALANDFGYNVVEVNASDYRGKNQLNETIGISVKEGNLFSKGKIFLIDDIDGLSGREDRGGISAVEELINSSYWPIILTVNNPWDKKFNTLRKKCELIDLSLNLTDIKIALEKICEKENLDVEDGVLNTISIMSNGDLRNSINSLELIRKKGKINESDLDVLGYKDERKEIFDILKVIFKGNSLKDALESLNKSNIDINELILWIDENVSKEYIEEELSKVYDKLSKADIFKGRIIKKQYWRFLVYVNILVSGISAFKGKSSFVSYKRPERLLKIWILNRANIKKNSIIEKISEKTHTSTKKTLNETYPYFKYIFKKFSKEITDDFDLTQEEIDFIKRQ